MTFCSTYSITFCIPTLPEDNNRSSYKRVAPRAFSSAIRRSQKTRFSAIFKLEQLYHRFNCHLFCLYADYFFLTLRSFEAGA